MMKKLLLLFFLIAGYLTVSAQNLIVTPNTTEAGNDSSRYIWYKFQYGNRQPRYWADSVLEIPKDTLFSKSGLARKSGVLYVGDGTRWYQLTPGGGIGADGPDGPDSVIIRNYNLCVWKGGASTCTDLSQFIRYISPSYDYRKYILKNGNADILDSVDNNYTVAEGGAGILLTKRGNPPHDTLNISATGGSSSSGLLQPGYVTHDTLYTYDVTAAIFRVGSGLYASASGSVTLATADGTFDRIDVIALDTLGHIVAVTGTASANPQIPQVNPTTQIALTSIIVKAGSTAPDNITREIVYDENVEYSHTATLTPNFNFTGNPVHLTKSIDIAAWTTSPVSAFTFTSPVKLNISAFNVLKFFIDLKATLPSNAYIFIALLNGSTYVTPYTEITSAFGLNRASTDYQNISVPFSALTITGTQFDKLQFYLYGPGPGMYLDYVQFQGGISTGGNQYGPVYKKAATDSIFQYVGGVPVFVYRDSTGGAGGGSGLQHVVAGTKLSNVNDSTLKLADSVWTNIYSRLAEKLKYTDSAAMLASYRSAIDAHTIALLGKQATLVSGTNIKTINSTSLLGSGNLNIVPGAGYVINVMDYGAVADGVTDNLTAIQAARDAAITLNAAIIFFPKGDYYLSDSVIFTKSVRIDGVGATQGMIDSTHAVTTNYYGHSQYSSRIKVAANKSAFVLKRNSADSTNPVITISNIAFTSNGVYTTSTRGAFIKLLDNIQNVTIRNCSFRGAHYQVDNSSAFYTRIENNVFLEPDSVALHISNTGRTDTWDGWVVNNLFLPGFTITPKIALFWESGGGIKLYGNKFDGSFAIIGGADADSAAAYQYDIYAKSVANTSDFLIANNSFENYSREGIKLDFTAFQVGNIQINNNQFAPIKASGAAVEVINGWLVEVDNYNIQNYNTILPVGIKITNCNGVHAGTGTITNYTAAYSITGSTNVSYNIDGQTALGVAPNIYGFSIVGNLLQMQPASGSFPGVVSTAAQTFAGGKTIAVANNNSDGVFVTNSSTGNAARTIIKLTNNNSKSFQLGVHGSGTSDANHAYIEADGDMTFGTDYNVASGGTKKIQFYTGGYLNAATPNFTMDPNGRFGIGQVSPTGLLHLKAGTTTASTAPIKMTAGSNLTTPEAGAVEFDGTNYFVTSSTTRYTLSKTLTNTATLDFSSTSAQTSSTLTITVTGAADGDVVYMAAPNASHNANTEFTAYVSATNTVTVKFNNYSSASVDPASGTFRVSVVKY